MSEIDTDQIRTPEDRAHWLVACLVDRQAFLPEVRAAAFSKPETAEGSLNWLSGQVPVPVLETLALRAEATVDLVLRDQRDRQWNLALELEPVAPYRMANMVLERRLPEGIEIRDARIEDNEAILEVCRSTPIDLGDQSVVIDPGRDYFAYSRLMDTAVNWVATDHGRPVATYSAAIYPIRCGGVLMRMAQALHTRVHPDYAGVGLFNVMNRRFLSAYRFGEAFDNGCAYISLGNDRTNRIGGAQAGWTVPPYRLSIPCSSSGVSRSARTATPAEAERVVAILNATHQGEELFIPYRVESLNERLSRDPLLYGWDRLFLVGDAVVGTWPVGQTRTITAADGTVERRVLALVLDYGFLPGREDDFIAAMEAAGAEAGVQGCTHLSIFSSDPSPGSALLGGIASSRDIYNFTTPYIPEPPGVADRGVYVDQIYF